MKTEPLFEKDGDEQAIPLKLTGCADLVQFSCETTAITFRPTLMFQARVFKFTVQNTGAVCFDFDWNIVNLALAASPSRNSSRVASRNSVAAAPSEPPCPFEISPREGRIAANESTEFTVRFAPLEIPLARDSTFRYCMDAQIGNLDSRFQPLRIDLNGVSQRPVCHFAVEETDYLDRRPADMPGPNGNLGLLDPSIKVIFFESLGTVRFTVIWSASFLGF